jgi:putative ABC transport system permease protein
MESFSRDMVYGLRALTHSPGFATVAVVSLALGIGANTAIFTLTDAVFLNPLPVENPARVMQLFTVDHATTTTTANTLRTPMSFLNYRDFRDQNHVFSGLAGFVPTGVTLTGRGEPKPEPAMLASANYFDVLGVKAAAGRTFLPDEDRKDGANTVTVFSHSLAVELFGSAAAAIAQTVEFNSVVYTVIGVTPPGFKGTFTVGGPESAWIPMSMHAQVLPGPLEQLFNERRMRMINVFGRLNPGVLESQAAAELRTIAASLEREYPRANHGRTVEVAPLSEAALGFLPRDQMVTAGIALTAVVALVLLIACANLANLLLARAFKRAREMGIRAALGADRSRLIRQLLTENLAISLAGGISGLLLGLGGSRVLWSFRPAFLPANSLPIHLDWRVFLFTTAVTILTSLLFGLVPAARTSGANLGEVLKTGGRTGMELATRNPLRSALVVGEISLALIALAGAGLLIRSMEHVQKINPGFETQNLFVFDFDIGPQHYSADRSREFLRSALDRAMAVPGVRSAALSSNRPLGGGLGLLATLFIEGQDADPNQRGTLTLLNEITPEYFDTLRIPLIAGRGFTNFDRVGSARVAVVSESMARHFWPGQNALGKRFRTAIDKQYLEVVGICANSVTTQIGEQPQPQAYLPLYQRDETAVTLHVCTNGNPAAVLPAVLKRVQSLNTNLPLTNPATIQELIGQGLWAPRMAAALFGVFGFLAIVLASIGIYGVIAYTVSQRTNEIGLRVAMGARPGDILGLVIGQGMRLAGAGIVMGIGGALAVTRLLGNLLFDIPTYDPATFGGVSVFVAGVALIAGWLPAWRAARLDPVLALRQH